jgi:hypothetical protein
MAKLIPKDDVVPPTVLELPKRAIARKGIEAFIGIDHAHDILSSTVDKHDYPVLDNHLVLLEKNIWEAKQLAP